MHPHNVRLTPRQADRVERAIRSTTLSDVLDENLATGDRIETLEFMVQRAYEAVADGERGFDVPAAARIIVTAHHNARAENRDQWADPERPAPDPVAAMAAANRDAFDPWQRHAELHAAERVVVIPAPTGLKIVDTRERT